MKIGIDARLWNETGVGRYIRNLTGKLQELDKTNDYVLFVKTKDYQTLVSQFQSQKRWNIVEADVHWHSIKEQVIFPQILYRENLDLMHFPYFSLPILYNKLFVVTIHDLINDHFPTGKVSALPTLLYKIKYTGYQFIIHQAAKRAKKIITVSQATKQEITSHLNVLPDKVVVTYEGVDEGLVTKGEREKINKIPFFLYVGNAYPHKNLERLIVAFQLLLHKNKDVRLILLGKTDYFYTRLKEKIGEARLAHKIHIAGYVSDEELSEYYHEAVALVVPSLMEGFGLPALEGMANSCPVIASNIPSLREVLEDAVLFADPLNPNDFAEKMELLLRSQEERLKLIQKGQSQIKKFSWNTLAHQTIDVYNTAYESNKKSDERSSSSIGV